MRAFFLIVSVFASTYLFSATSELTLFIFHDSFECSFEESKQDLSRMMSALEKERKKASNHITVLGGDFFSSSFFSHWDKGSHIIEILNAMQVNFVCLGCHELNYGAEVLTKRVKQSSFGWLAANVINAEDRPFTGEKQVHIFNINQTKIGIFGLVDEKIIGLSNSGEDVFILPFSFVAKKIVEQMKKAGVDVIIALTNLSMDKDKLLAQMIPEINVIIGIHDEDPLCWFENDTLIHKAGFQSDNLTRIDLKIEKNLAPFHPAVHVYPVWKMVRAEHFPKHKKLTEKIEEVRDKQTTLYIHENAFDSPSL